MAAERSGGQDALQVALGSSYRVERELGRGGMATVYLAVDAKHGRSVALKVLHADLAASLGPERFRREITLAANLQHPHILTVLDSGETAAGQMWFTMPYVEGETLRDRIRRERQLPVDEALRIAREVADALQYAHSHGVVHRDIKPENILLTGSHALVADFGIARALTSAARGAAASQTLTETGTAVGTPSYMSPEQAAGDRDLDARTDIYSLGAVLYEMLAGEPPFTGPTAQAIVAKMMTSAAPSVRVARPSVPERVDTAVRKALSPVPADRFATVGEFGQTLEAAERTMSQPATTTGASRVATPATARRRLPPMAAALALGFLVGIGALFAWRNHSAATSSASGPATLAVLPFENLGDSADAYFADGITDEVRGKLGTLTGVQVIASASSNAYRHTTKTPEEIGKELGVRYLLLGRVRWEKHPGGTSRVRVDPELVQVADVSRPTMRWQEPFDADLSDVFKVQADIAGKVAQELKVALTPSAEHLLAERPTENLAAYDAFLKGEAMTQRMGINDPNALARGLAFYQQAITLDSTFAPAWAELARAEALLYVNGNSATEHADAAKQAVSHAVALAPNRVETSLAECQYSEAVLGDNERALTACTAALAATPKNAEVLTELGNVERSLDHWDSALEHYHQAAQYDPRTPLHSRRLADTYLFLRRYPEALASANRVLAIDPGNLDGIQDEAMIALVQGDLAGARAVLRAVPATVDPGELEAFMATYWDTYWVLDDAQQRHLLSLSADAFGGDSAGRLFIFAEVHQLRGDKVATRIYADSARLAYERLLRTTPNNPAFRISHGISLAYLGKNQEALEEEQRAVVLTPISADHYGGTYNQHQLARTAVLVGKYEKALDEIEPLLKIPYFLTPAFLKIDPNFEPLHGNPRFERLISGR